MAEKKGLLSGNLFPKIVLIIAIAVIISAVIFGLPTTVPEFIWFIIRILIGLGLFVFGIMVIQKVVTTKPIFSPTESWENKCVKMAEMSKPKRTRKLVLSGEDMRIHYTFGKITGLLFMPNWAGAPIVDKKTGKLLYIHKVDKLGNKMYDKDGKPIMINQVANINEKDGDWLIVISKGLMPALSKKILVRANHKLIHGIGEEICIKTVNLLSVGRFWYPNQQYQADIVRINMQSLAETVEETHQHFLDLAATTTESSLRSDPIFVKMMSINSENISNKEVAPISALGQKG